MVQTVDTSAASAFGREHSFVLPFRSVGIVDIPLVGGKNASLGEMLQELTPKGINVPDGFATTAYAYRYFIQIAGLEEKLRLLFADLDVEDVTSLRWVGKQARSLILQTPFPDELQEAIAVAQEKGRKIGICGQAPSDYPEFARFLVELGIDSISLNPDSVLKTMLDIADTEKAIEHQHSS